MQAFSTTVRDLYALAEYAAPDQFLSQAVGLMQSWIRFDGVIFGTGEAGGPQGALAMLQGSAGQGLQGAAGAALAGTTAETLLSMDAFRDDPVAHGIRNAPLSPSRGGIRELYRKSRDGKRPRGRSLSGVRTLADELGLCHLMIHGDDARRVKPARWIVLYRCQDVRFAETDAACLHGLWGHLSKALTINRTRAIERRAAAGQSSPSDHPAGYASGLITADGTVEIADQRFFDLLEREWPELAPEMVPVEVMVMLNEGKAFRGTQIEISMVRQNSMNLCRIRPIPAMEVLTPREFVVARRFAAGMSHKQIARELGVSHHTIRNQLAHLYRKLKLHDKASLAHYLVTNATPT